MRPDTKCLRTARLPGEVVPRILHHEPHARISGELDALLHIQRRGRVDHVPGVSAHGAVPRVVEVWGLAG